MHKKEENIQQEKYERKLDWTKTLFDYHICLDAQEFDKWDRNMQIPNQDVLEKDIPRTRNTHPQMLKQSFRDVLRRMATFYCKQNRVNYQQGLLEVVFPFALLRRKDFATKKCYAYFNAFMRKHFPKVLVQRIVQHKKQLPYAMLALTLTECLLNYHYPAIANGLRKEQVQMSMIATQQLMTVFAKGLELEFVFEVYDYFIKKNDPNFVFYMMVGLFGVQEQKIMQALESGEINRFTINFKKINSKDDLKQWLKLSDEIAKKTPPMFGKVAEDFRFSNHNILTLQDMENMLNSGDILSRGLLPISIQQVDQNPQQYVFVLIRNKLDTQKYQQISMDPDKQLDLSLFDPDKTYVLAAHEQKKQQQLNFLLGLADKKPACRFLVLKQSLITNEKPKKSCRIF